MTKNIRLDFEAGVGSICLDDGSRFNWLTPGYLDALAAVVDEAQERIRAGDIRALMIWGDAHFSAGESLEQQRDWSTSSTSALVPELQRQAEASLCLLDLPVPTVAIATGAVLRSGLALAWSCDLVLIGDEAWLGAHDARRQLHPAAALVPLAEQRLGRHKAREYFLTELDLEGRDASRAGLATETYSDPHAEAQKLCKRMAGFDGPQLQAMKQTLAIDKGAVLAALPTFVERQAAALTSSAAKVAIAEALKRRSAVFARAESSPVSTSFAQIVDVL